MALTVQKFGGTSVATSERIMAAARRAIRAKQLGNQVIVVVSARGDTTDGAVVVTMVEVALLVAAGATTSTLLCGEALVVEGLNGG